MAKVNYREIARACAKSPVGRKRIETFARQRFEKEKLKMLEDFDNHPVTKEIEAGSQNPDGAPNISATLPGSTGNLYSFIGFEGNPIQDVRQALDDGTTLIASNISPDGEGIRCKFSVKVETERIQQAAPLPFEAGKSWTDSVEKGLSGFSHFLAGKFTGSRSGGGIQVKNEVRSQTYKPVPYLSKILRDFTARLRTRK